MNICRLIFLLFYILGVSQGIKWDAIVSYFFPTSSSIQKICSGTNINKLSQKDINTSLKQGERLIKVISDNQDVGQFPSQAMKNFFGGGLTPEQEMLNTKSKATLLAAKILQNKFVNMGAVTENSFVSFINARGYKGLAGKHSKDFCSSVKYRSLDGTCNNLERPVWGSTNTPFMRLGNHRYADGLYSMPVAKSGNPLPSPRLISSKLFTDQPTTNQIHTIISAHWGQIIAHDMSMGVIEQNKMGAIQCCQSNGSALLSDADQHSACAPVEVPKNDPFYNKHNVRYLNFVRSITTPNLQGSVGPAEQVNSVSSYIDGSSIYSTEKEIIENIRTFKKGQLKLTKDRLLPSASNSHELCDTSLSPGKCPCYSGGDPRINQTPILAALQTLLAREHNRIAKALSEINPHWNDEKLFEETRRIINAIIQHITFQEWLPLTIGKAYVRQHNISPTSLFSFDYNCNINAGISNAFSNAAFRFFHTLIPGEFMLLKSDGQNKLCKLRNYFMRPGVLEEEEDGFDSVIRGSLQKPAMEADDCFSTELTNFIFKSTNPWGMDLTTLDIQRCRDHGLDNYNTFRSICGLKRAECFEDLSDCIPPEKISLLKEIYEDVDDIDLFVGGMYEKNANGSLLGPTFQCIIAEQFYRSRIGDRYFYDVGDMPHSFTPDQLRELKKVTMSRLICDNGNYINQIQKKAFEMICPDNPICSCYDYENIPVINLSYWRD